MTFVVHNAIHNVFHNAKLWPLLFTMSFIMFFIMLNCDLLSFIIHELNDIMNEIMNSKKGYNIVNDIVNGKKGHNTVNDTEQFCSSTRWLTCLWWCYICKVKCPVFKCISSICLELLTLQPLNILKMFEKPKANILKAAHGFRLQT